MDNGVLEKLKVIIEGNANPYKQTIDEAKAKTIASMLMTGQQSKTQTMAFGTLATTMDIQKWDTLRKHL